MENSKEQAKGIKQKVTDLLKVVKDEISPKDAPAPPENVSSVSLCARTIPYTEAPPKYRKSLKALVCDSSFIKESRLMDMPAKPRDYDRFVALKELDEVNQVKKQFASALHLKNVSGMLLKADGISYCMQKPNFYPSSDLYEVPGLKTELLRIKVPFPRRILQATDSDTEYSKKTKKEIYFTPKRLRKYPD